MKKILYSFYINFKFFLFEYLLYPLLLAAAVVIIIIAADCLRKKERFGLTKLTGAKNQLFSIFLTVLYYSVLYNSTVTSRLRLGKQNPFSNIWGGWRLYETQYFYDFSALWNILIFLPACAVLYYFIKSALKKSISDKGLIALSFISSLFFSGIIEASQILTYTGTFQISDLVYNSIGGLLGGVIFILIKNRIQKGKA